MLHQDFSNSTNVTERTLAEQAADRRLPSMTFVPYEPSHTVIVGDWAITMYFLPAIYVQSPAGEREFSSRLEADLYMAQEIRRLRYLAGFNAYMDGHARPADTDKSGCLGWNAASRAQAQAETHDAKIERNIFGKRE